MSEITEPIDLSRLILSGLSLFPVNLGGHRPDFKDESAE
jgi:hypothetical protein